MFKIIRTVCAVISACSVVAAAFLGMYSGMPAFWAAAAAALLFFALSMLFKYLQEEKEGVRTATKSLSEERAEEEARLKESGKTSEKTAENEGVSEAEQKSENHE